MLTTEKKEIIVKTLVEDKSYFIGSLIPSIQNEQNFILEGWNDRMIVSIFVI